MPFVIAVIIIALLIAIALSIAVRVFFKIAFLRDDREKPAAKRLDMPWTVYIDDITDGELSFFDLPLKRVQITSHDGLKLRALYAPCKDARATLIMMHGYRSDGFADFSTVFNFYRSLGFNLLLPHHRAHLTSEGRFITFGLKERYDCLGWIKYVNENIGGEVWLLGVSMGAATVMMASELGLPPTVRGIIADCGYTSPWEELKYVLKRDYGLPPFPMMHLTNRRLKRLAGVSLKDASCIEALSHCKVPILFIHGSADRFVPCDMTYQNYESCICEKAQYISPGAAHAVTCWVDPHGYRSSVRGFIEKYQKNDRD